MRRQKSKQRILIRRKMGKPVFFTLTHCQKKLRGLSNQYNYKSNMHGLLFIGTKFFNVKYQASIMTECNFRDSFLTGVDFFNSNMKGVSFKNATLKNVVFYNCKNGCKYNYKDGYKNLCFIVIFVVVGSTNLQLSPFLK